MPSLIRVNKRDNSAFTQNLLRYLRSKYQENINFNCFTESYDEYKSKNLFEDSTDSYEKIFKDIPKINLQNIVTAQLNINSLRNKFDFLAEKIKGIIDVLLISEIKLDESFFQLASFKFLDTTPHSAWIMVNRAEELWFLSEKIFQLNLLKAYMLSYIFTKERGC